MNPRGFILIRYKKRVEMRILIFDNSYDGRSMPKSGGDNVHSYEFSRFAEKKHAVRLVKWHFGKKLLVSNKKWGLEIVFPTALKKIPLLPFVGLLLLLVKEIVRFNAQTLIAYKAYPNGFPAAVAAKLTKRICLIRPSGADLHLRPKKMFPRLLIGISARHSAGLVCITGWMSRICELFGGTAYRVVGGVNSELFGFVQKKSIPKKGRVIAYIGRFEPQKDIATLVRIIRALPQHKFILAGEGKLSAFLQKSKYTNVAYLGAVPHRKIPAILRKAHFLVLPTQYEGLSNAILEAYSEGVVVVCSDAIGNRELVKNKRTGYLCKGYEDFVRVLDGEKIVAEYGEISKNARKLAETHDIKNYLAQVEAILKDKLPVD